LSRSDEIPGSSPARSSLSRKSPCSLPPVVGPRHPRSITATRPEPSPGGWKSHRRGWHENNPYSVPPRYVAATLFVQSPTSFGQLEAGPLPDMPSAFPSGHVHPWAPHRRWGFWETSHETARTPCRVACRQRAPLEGFWPGARATPQTSRPSEASGPPRPSHAAALSSRGSRFRPLPLGSRLREPCSM
jgi:hypothetical protein